MARLTLPVAVVAAVVWVRAAPMRPDHYGDGERRAAVTYRGEDGQEHVYLGGYDSYHWLRAARNLLRSGSVCDEIRDGECRETLAHAPVGRRMRYSAPLHPAAIAALHRLLVWFHPGYPLPSSAFWLGVLVAAFGVLPAFALGSILAGPLGGVAAALVLGLNPLFLQRTLDADNDVWNVLPLCAAWGLVTALRAPRRAGRVGLAALAAAVVAVHARAWAGWTFGAAVLLIALASSGVILALRIPLRRGVERTRAAHGLGHTALVLGVFAALLAVAAPRTDLAAMARGVRDNAAALLPAPAPPPAAVGDADFAPWPDTLAGVAELSRPNLASIAHAIGGPLYFFAGWLGLLVLLLPRRGWVWWHFTILIAGNFLYRFLLSGVAITPAALLGLLALPLIAALLVAVVERGDVCASDLLAGQIVLWWFLAALHLSFAAVRFTILLVPPFALAFAAALGRAQQWWATSAAPTPLLSRRSISLFGSAALAAALWIPFQRGRATVRATAPDIDDAWWGALTRLRDDSPPEAIINTWWDYGYWAKYVAERRVSADGGSLLTHIPYWLAHALLASSEDETAGLLRMLNCASDATPEAEGRQGAWARLVAAGVDPLRAPALVTATAGRDAAGADALLAANGITAAQRAAILAATHCAPPPAYLVVSSRLALLSPLRSLGSFDAARAYALHLADSRPPEEAIEALRLRLGVSAEEATALDRAARAPRDGAQRVEFVSPAADYFARGWQSCAVVDRDLVCAIRPLAGAPPLREFRYPRAAPVEGFFVGAAEARLEPQLVLLNDAAGLREIHHAATAAAAPAAAALIDADRQRVLVGPPYLIRSTLTRLLYLDRVAGSRFEPVDAQTASAERVTVWRVR